MTNTQPTSPENQEEIKNIEQKSPLETEIESTIEKFGGLLSEKFSKEVDEKDEKLKVLIMDFERAIKEKEEEIGYNYGDYEERLCMIDENFEKGFYELTKSDTEIGKLYNSIIGEYDGSLSKKIIIKKLKDNYLEDLIYDNIDDFSVDSNKHLILINYDLCRTDKERVEEIFKNSMGFKNLSLMNNKFRKAGKERLKKIFENLNRIKGLNLENSYLGELDKNSLEEIFKNLKGLKGLGLENNSLWELDKDSLEVIFKNLRGLKSLGLEDNYLGKLDEDSLKVIFKNLRGLKNLKLYGNKLKEEQKELIRNILPNTKIVFYKNKNKFNK